MGGKYRFDEIPPEDGKRNRIGGTDQHIAAAQ